MDEEDDVFLVSFTDALTCVFGAAIALFLIFVVLVKLAPPVSATASGATPRLKMQAALESDSKTGQSTAVITVSAASCSETKGLTVRPSTDIRVWDVERIGTTGSRCSRIFEVTGGLPTTGLTIFAPQRPQRGIGVYIEVGAASFPSEGALRVSHTPSEYCRQDGRIVKLLSSEDDFISKESCAR